MSLLRLIGLVAGAVLLVLLILRQRHHSQQRIDVWGLSFVGMALVLVSLFPDLVNLPAELFFLDDIKGGRIITLLILAVIVLTYIATTNRARLVDMKFQLDRFIQNNLARDFVRNKKKSLTPETVIVLMPAFNEAENLAKVLPRIPKKISGRPVRCLVANDGSTDNTEKVAEKYGALVISHPFNRGGGAALRTGYAVAELAGTDMLVTMDADGQHDPAEIETLLTPILEGRADFVIGSRMLGGYDNYSGLRILGVHLFNGVINLLMGTKITDCASGFRAIRFGALGKINLQQDQYHTSELIIDAAKKGLRISEEPIHIAARLHGESKKGHSVLYAFGFFKAVLNSWWR